MLLGTASNLLLIAIFGSLLSFGFPIGIGNSRAIWQTKVEPAVQGRVFSARRMAALFLSPLVALISGPMVENYFQPWLEIGGALAGSAGKIVGVGDGRGISFAFLVSGLLLLICRLVAIMDPLIHRLEVEIPDVIVKEREQTT